MVAVDQKSREVLLSGDPDDTVRWKPGEIAGRRGGSEVYRVECIELRAKNRIRWIRNDKALGLVNSRTAEVVGVEGGKVSFRLEAGGTLELGKGDPQVRHLDHAWASTVHAFQGRTVDNVIAPIEATLPNLTIQSRSTWKSAGRGTGPSAYCRQPERTRHAPGFRTLMCAARVRKPCGRGPVALPSGRSLNSRSARISAIVR